MKENYESILSHPQKKLITHMKGVLSHMSDDDYSKILSLFHDLFKFNPNFQKKIRGDKFQGYDEHSYGSAYYLINGFINNIDDVKDKFKNINDENWEIILLLLINIIVGHHGHLRDIGKIFYDEKWDEMIKFLKKNPISDKLNEFYNENKKELNNCIFKFVDDHENGDFYKGYQNLESFDKYRKRALHYYLLTLTLYSELVNGDRRDASNNISYYRKSEKLRYNYSLDNNLKWLFRKFNTNELNDLNKMRNIIREDSVKRLQWLLKNKPQERVFTLTAPTAAGKTLLMLELALTILREAGMDKYDILYAIPFLSIADQTSKIINNDLKIETLNYTSSADTTDTLEELMLKSKDRNELLKYSFSENSLDHPFVLTTFNQLFETFFSNTTSKILKLKNLKNRIILVDEYQALQPTQYYFMLKILQEFCTEYDSYAIISTATMPYFKLDLDDVKNSNFKILFNNEIQPNELLSYKIFNSKVFNRYDIHFIGEMDANNLTNNINRENDSVLCIMNSVRSSRRIYGILRNSSNYEKTYLLNAKLCPLDRIKIIENIKEDLNNNKKILVVSTQVVEAGVDISFPIVYRDAAPPSSITQSGGRCNRSWEYDRGNMKIFLYKDDDPTINQYDCDMIYHGLVTKSFRNDVKNMINSMSEKEFHEKTNRYFYGLSKYIDQGITDHGLDLSDLILNGRFGEIGKYRTIESNPDSICIYIGNDDIWQKYNDVLFMLNNAKSYSVREIKSIEFKKIRSEILQRTININENDLNDLSITEEAVFGVHKLLDNNQYNSEFGLL